MKTAHRFNWRWRLLRIHTLFFILCCHGLELAAAQLTPNTSTAATDLEALQDFNDSLSSSSLSLWTGSTFCNWNGVVCSHGRVVELNLPSQGLSGTIPPSLQNLTNLGKLVLPKNNISGDIPTFIGTFSNLTYLDLSGNLLSGPIPSTVANLSRVTHLDLSLNSLSGTIPTSICALSSATLIFLSLGSNILTGTIPDDLGSCVTLQRLYLGLNQLSGNIPDSFESLVKLQTLDLSFNNLTGAISRLPNALQFLTLRDNMLTGNLSKQSGHLPDALKLLSLSRNRLGDEIPAEIGTLSNLINLELNDNSFRGIIPDTWEETSLLEKLDLSANNLSGVIPSSVANLTNLNILQLDSNSLSGGIPASIGILRNLSIIDLANNKLTGEIPPEIVDLLSVTVLDVSYNNLSGTVPSGLYELTRWKNADVYTNNNPNLLQQSKLAPGPAPSPDKLGADAPNSEDRSSWALRAILAFDALLVLLDAYGLYAYWRLARPKEEKVVAIPEPNIEDTVTVDELRKMTNNFHEDSIIGLGARSIVYKGIVGGGQVAVKVLRKESAEKDRESLLRELQTLGRVRHRNLLRILAVCSDVEMRALVLEYMPFSSLYHFLYKMVGKVCLSWDTRFNILVGVAQGLVYLHREHQEPIIHCDLKPSNILLDSDFEPKVADFGIAKYVNPCSGDASMSGLCGTIGYIPPEYAWASSASTKGDVFSFGIVLLEILTARTPYEGWDVERGQPGSLMEFVASAYPDDIMSILDPNLVMLEVDGDLHEEELRMIVKIGLMCTEVDPKNRPDMIYVLNELTNIKLSRYSSAGRRRYRSIDELVQLPTLWELPDDPTRCILQESEETNLEYWVAKRMP